MLANQRRYLASNAYMTAPLPTIAAITQPLANVEPNDAQIYARCSNIELCSEARNTGIADDLQVRTAEHADDDFARLDQRNRNRILLACRSIVLSMSCIPNKMEQQKSCDLWVCMRNTSQKSLCAIDRINAPDIVISNQIEVATKTDQCR
jgi:hypothetical protein